MNKFTKQHYEAIAKIVAVARQIESDESLDVLTCFTTGFCRMFKADNPNFDSEKFIEACQNRERGRD